MWALTTTVYLTEKQLSGPDVSFGFPYKTTQNTNVCKHTTIMYITGKQLLGPQTTHITTV